MSYSLRLIGRDRPTLKRRIADAAIPDALRLALTLAVDDLVTEDTSPASYVTLIQADGNDEAHEISATFSVRRIEAIDDVLVLPEDPERPFSQPAVVVAQPVETKPLVEETAPM